MSDSFTWRGRTRSSDGRRPRRDATPPPLHEPAHPRDYTRPTVRHPQLAAIPAVIVDAPAETADSTALWLLVRFEVQLGGATVLYGPWSSWVLMQRAAASWRASALVADVTWTPDRRDDVDAVVEVTCG